MSLEWKEGEGENWWEAWHGPNHYFLSPDTEYGGYWATYVAPCLVVRILGWGPTLDYAKGLVDIWLDYVESEKLQCMCGHPSTMHDAKTGTCKMCDCDDYRMV